jgi:transposase InsO family protein
LTFPVEIRVYSGPGKPLSCASFGPGNGGALRLADGNRLTAWASPRSAPIAIPAPHHLQHQFDVVGPNRVWAIDITYIRTHEGWLFLAADIDLFSRQVIGWSTGMGRSLAINALLMAMCAANGKNPSSSIIYG